ncbi:unnamed protein product [Blepharisma stoltei]|uniref:Uncharacterized protein n=1 Tax=Blepharisma stoltei TaxID=1481888 RepID=A0AAU9KMY2_9CILI|nr:unnamed protein product [Blepharisma stoltei]
MLLNDNEAIENLGIKDGDIIEAQHRALGGATNAGFIFANLSHEKEVHLKFDENAPVWRTAKRGISFKTKCYNPKCEASREGFILVN